jgi:hypothetical protein
MELILLLFSRRKGGSPAPPALREKSVAKKPPFLNGSVCEATRHRRLKSQDLIEVIGVLMLL